MQDQETTSSIEDQLAELEREEALESQEGVEESSQVSEPDSSEPLSAEEAPADEEGQFTIPEKFVGKTAMDVARAYSEVEKHAGKLSSEKAEAEKRAKELEDRLQQLEQQHASVSQSQPQQAPPEEQDPYSWLDEELDSNPKEAIKKLAQVQREEARRVAEQQEITKRAQAAESYYYQQKKENPDFVELEPVMQQVAQEFGHLINKDFVNSPETIRMAYELAKARNLSKYVSRELESAKQKGTLANDEKRRAVSESSNSKRSENVPFDKLSVDDMEKALGIEDDNDEF